jgi:hypothetical protein
MQNQSPSNNYSFFLISLIVLFPLVEIFTFINISTNVQYAFSTLIVLYIILCRSKMIYKKKPLLLLLLFSLYPQVREFEVSLEWVGAIVIPFILYEIWRVFSNTTKSQVTIFVYVNLVIVGSVIVNLYYENVNPRTVAADLSLYCLFIYILSSVYRFKLITPLVFLITIGVSVYYEARIVMALATLLFVLKKISINLAIKKFFSFLLIIILIAMFIGIIYYEVYYLNNSSNLFSGRGVIWAYYILHMLNDPITFIIGYDSNLLYNSESLEGDYTGSYYKIEYIVTNNMYHNGFLSILYKTGVVGLLAIFYTMVKGLKKIKYEYLGFLIYLVFSLYYFMNGKFLITLDPIVLVFLSAFAIYFSSLRKR